jgi:hypothetical protein
MYQQVFIFYCNREIFTYTRDYFLGLFLNCFFSLFDAVLTNLFLGTSGNDQILLQEYISQIDFLTTETLSKNIESKIRIEASKNESVKILMSMTGIDFFSAIPPYFDYLIRNYSKLILHTTVRPSIS